MHKRIIILDHNKGGRLANQLWNFICIYAYSQEKNITCDNYSFFQYSKYFNIPVKNFWVKILLLGTLPQKLKYRLHRRFVRYMNEKNPSQVFDSGSDKPTYLPPSSGTNPIANKQYLTGWLFRNPVGIEKYRKETKQYFKPKNSILNKVANIISPLRKQYDEIIGVHIRQTDYKLVGTGEHFFETKEVVQILKDYIENRNDSKNIVFLICSDSKLNQEDFAGLNFVISDGNEAEDLFILASTDRIIGSNSTYGAFSAYYGNIPIKCFSRENIDWADFNKSTKFEYYNECTFVQQ